jgi:acyl dehydratase
VTAAKPPRTQTVFESLDDLRAATGTLLGISEWIDVTPERVALFAAARGTTEPEEAADAIGVPEHLTLALTNRVLPEILEVRGASVGVNYGTGRVRFPAPVPVGSRVRGRAELVACDDIPGGVQTSILVTIEVEGADEPACVVESLSRWLA